MNNFSVYYSVLRWTLIIEASQMLNVETEWQSVIALNVRLREL